jgi:hypothetical protein
MVASFAQDEQVFLSVAQSGKHSSVNMYNPKSISSFPKKAGLNILL